MARCVGLSSAWLSVKPGAHYPLDWPVPDTFTGRGRWSSGPLHTFVDDWRQEFFWRKPQEGLLVALSAGVCTAPDYTVYTDDPPAWRTYQAWRSAMVAGYWLEWGVQVLPVISFESGCEQYVGPASTWSIRGPARTADDRQWLRHLSTFVERAAVGRLVVFGRLIPECLALGIPIEARKLNERSQQVA